MDAGLTEAKDLIPIWMEEHRVPGVSITLFEDGEIAWSKDIGVRSTESGEEVTPDTIFEAGVTASLASRARGVGQGDEP